MRDPLLLDVPESIQTARLDLRIPRPSDGVAVCEGITESLEELRKFLGSLPWAANEPSIEASETFCRRSAAQFMARGDFPFLLFERPTGRFVGATGLHRVDWGVPKIEVGYWRRTSAGGRGFVREAVAAVVLYAFVELKMERVELITDSENWPSRRVAEATGFRLEGVLRRDRRAPDGSLRDTCVYARLRDEQGA